MGRMNRNDPIWLVGALLLAGVLSAPARAQETQTETWRKVREAQFAGRTFEADADQVVLLEAPNRAEDAAVVPILIHAVQPQQPQRWIRRIYLVIDKNPSPLGAVFSARRQGPGSRDGAPGPDENPHRGRCSAGSTEPGRADDQPPERVRTGDGSGHAPVRLAPLRPDGAGQLCGQARDERRHRLHDQRKPELPLLLRPARRWRPEGRSGGFEQRDLRNLVCDPQCGGRRVLTGCGGTRRRDHFGTLHSFFASASTSRNRLAAARSSGESRNIPMPSP